MQSGTLESFSTRKSSAKFFRQIYSEEGVRGLYRVSVGSEDVCVRVCVSVFTLLPSPLPSLLPSLLPSSQGVGPTAQRAAVIAGVLLPSYDFFKKLILDSGLLRDNIATHFL